MPFNILEFDIYVNVAPESRERFIPTEPVDRSRVSKTIDGWQASARMPTLLNSALNP
jgi:hypothetical protein